MNYEQEIQNSAAIKPQELAAVFDYRDTPMEEIFHNLYLFCRENLDIHSQKKNIKPNVFAFTSGLTSNAAAVRTSDNKFGIFVNTGLIKYCLDNFSNNLDLDDYLFERFPLTVEFFDIPVSDLAFQLATQFTYYHELAHLVQYTKKAEESFLQERDENCNVYNETKHILEINADTFASIAISSHIQQYLANSFKDNLTQEHVEKTILILCCCLLNYMTSFYHDLANVYFKEYCHPHPIIRLFNVVLNITHNLNHSNYLQQKNIIVDTKNLSKQIIEFYIELEQQLIFHSKFQNALESSFAVKDQIVEYLGELIEFKTDEYYNAMDYWNNQHIT